MVAFQGLTEGDPLSSSFMVVGRTQVFTGCQQEFLICYWLEVMFCLFLCRHLSPTTSAGKASKRERQLARWKSQSCNLVTEVIPHHFGCILFLRSKSLDPAKRGLHLGMNTKSWGSLRATLDVVFHTEKGNKHKSQRETLNAFGI